MAKTKLPEGADPWHAEDTDPRMLAHDLDSEGDTESGIDYDLTTADVYNDLIKGMLKRGIKAVAVPGGEWAGFEMYVNSKFDVPGLTPSPDFRYWKTLHTTNDEDILLVQRAITDVASECSEGKPKAIQHRWLSFVEALTAFQRDEQTALYKVSRGRQTTQPYRTRTFNGTSGHYVVVPPKSWYPDNVQAVDARSLLTLLPDAEARMFMLNMGRVVVGWSNQMSAEGRIYHEYRYFVGMIGGANLGKTTLVEKYLKPAVVKMGLKTSVWNIGKDNKFGWAKRACADWYTLPDVITANTINVITDPQQKILSAGEPLTTEEKCQGDVIIDRPAAGGFVFMANAVDSPKLQLLDDDGITDRFKCLLCKERVELQNEYGIALEFDDPTALEGMVGIYWEKLAKKLGTSVEVLALWFMTCCAELFLSVCGYTWEDGWLKPGSNRLKREVAMLTDQLRAGTIIANKKDVVRVLKNLVALALSRCYYKDRVIAKLHELEFSYHLLAMVVEVQKLIYEKDRNSDVNYDFSPFLMETLAHHSVCYHLKKHGSDYLKRADAQVDLNQAFLEVTKVMKTRAHMFGYPSHPAAYSSEWKSAVIEIPILAEQFASVPEPDLFTGSVINGINTELAKIL